MSGKLLRGRAMEPIAAGAYVLCRNFEVRNSPGDAAQIETIRREHSGAKEET